METCGGMISVKTGVRSRLECKGTSLDLLGSAELGLASLLLPTLVSSDAEDWLVACSWERFGGGFLPSGVSSLLLGTRSDPCLFSWIFGAVFVFLGLCHPSVSFPC